MNKNIDIAALRFGQDGLLPAVVQDIRSSRVLMFAWVNIESLEKSLETGETFFFSRSRQALWHKGATSGNVQKIVSIEADCDADTILIQVEAAGPACHNGTESCFDSFVIGPGE